ncbi:MAG TPA: PBP1A family penicillin-binding protein [Treponemataceae bacterium]|nr:PBP1A family penicillin-binding protein [Treponemataceae bacterium]
MATIKKRTIFYFLFTLFFALLFGLSLGLLLANTVNTIHTENFYELEIALPTRLLDINGEFITEFASAEKRELVDYIDLPKHMIDALISREDNDFFQHSGFKVKAIVRAVLGKLLRKNWGGGSTLTQQIAGTVYADRSDMSYRRKLRELFWTFQIERRYAKEEILELYLNKIVFGNGTYGVSAASKYYFGHGPDKITPAEAAILVSQLSAPVYNNPFEYPARAKVRQEDVLNKMVKYGFLSQEIAAASLEDYWAHFDYTRTSVGAYFLREDKAPWFSAHVLSELINMMYGSNVDVYTSGYTVNTTMNLKHQLAAQRIMDERIRFANRENQRTASASSSVAVNTYIPMTELISLVFNLPSLKVSEQRSERLALSAYKNEINPILDVASLLFGMEDLKISVVNKANVEKSKDVSKDSIEGCLITIENETGHITALIGGGQYSTENQFNRATQGLLQPGSTFKPLYYSAAIDSRKLTAASKIADVPTLFYNESGVPYYPKNFKGEWMGTVQLWYALAKSMNVPSLKVLEAVGFDAAIKRSTALLGIPESQYKTRDFSRVYPLGLGTAIVKPIELARAYAVFGNQGREVTPISILSVEDKKGKIIANPEQDLRAEQKKKGSAIQVISPQNAFIMTDILSNSVLMGTMAYGSSNGKKLEYRRSDGTRYTIPAAGKTGTTQNWSDAWAVGYTPYMTTVIWFGFSQKGKTLGLSLTGSTLSGVAWGDFMREAHEGYPYKAFSEPQTGLVKATVCSVSGLLLTEACGKSATTQYFLEGTQPLTMCDYHINRETAREIGALRLLDAKYQSGAQKAQIQDTGGLVLDLSFLNIKTSEDLNKYKQEKESSAESDTIYNDFFFTIDDQDEDIDEDDEMSNFLLD